MRHVGSNWDLRLARSRQQLIIQAIRTLETPGQLSRGGLLKKIIRQGPGLSVDQDKQADIWLSVDKILTTNRMCLVQLNNKPIEI